MIDNPFAKVFRKAFETDILGTAIYTPTQILNTEPRVKTFLNSLNRFLRSSGQAPILYQKYLMDEHKIFEYALFLRGYMRDSQKILADLKQQYATDNELIKLFEASSEYVVSCNNRLNNKKIFDNNVSYHTWKMDLSDGLQKAAYTPTDSIDKSRHNLFLFMPFRLKDNEQTLNTWMFKNMRQSLDNRDIFSDKVDTYVVFYPIQKSRCSNITSLLKTLRQSDSFYEPEDFAFMKQYWADFIAKDLKFDENGKVISAQKYTPEKLKANFGNITIFSYCAGTANAHRSLNVLYETTEQIYGEKIAQEAMKNVFVTSYGFLPPQEKLRYSGVHFYTNAVNDENHLEPFVNLNNHPLYKMTKCRQQDGSARISIMPDKQNCVIALKLSEKNVRLNNGEPEVFNDSEYGHNLNNVNAHNLASKDDYSYNIFKSVLENSSIGIRGRKVLSANTPSPDLRILNSAIISRRQYL